MSMRFFEDSMELPENELVGTSTVTTGAQFADRHDEHGGTRDWPQRGPLLGPRWRQVT